MLWLPHAAWVHDSLLFQPHRERQVRVPYEDNIGLQAPDLRSPLYALGGAVFEQRFRRGGVAKKESIAVNCAGRSLRKSAQERPLINAQEGFRVVLHLAGHLPEGVGALWV